MDRYQLATIASWGGPQGIDGRKRFQKVVFLLQAAGCPLDCQFTLHHYGPYSRDAADKCDEMVTAGLLVEQSKFHSAGVQYSYNLKPESVNYLNTASTNDKQSATTMERFHEMGENLLNHDIWQLELGSTILFFYQRTGDWEHALYRGCQFKKVPTEDAKSLAAFELAKKVASFEGASR